MTLLNLRRNFLQCKDFNMLCIRQASPLLGCANKFVYAVGNYAICQAFVEVYKAWEYFLPQTIYYYAIGKTSINHHAPVRKIFPTNLVEAEQMVRNKSCAKYHRWTDAKYIVELTQSIFQDGEPYREIIGPVVSVLREMKILRTAICHNSSSSQEEFRTLIRQKLGVSKIGYVPLNFLLDTSSASNLFYYQEYFQYLEKLAIKITEF